LPKESPLAIHIHSSYVKHHLKQKLEKQEAIRIEKEKLEKLRQKKLEEELAQKIKLEKEAHDIVTNNYLFAHNRNRMKSNFTVYLILFRLKISLSIN